MLRYRILGVLPSEGHAVLEDGDVAVSVLLPTGLSALGNGDTLSKQLVGKCLHFGTAEKHARVKIDPTCFFLGKRGVGRDLHGRHGAAKGCSPPRGKEDHVCARRRKIGHRHLIVTGPYTR